ncbi:autotransporter-associated beta strand repeat-containing protein [Porticoccus sp.]|nr:autotransporter-associated beta strand repeat-containing protein [Porticoccus sp.]
MNKKYPTLACLLLVICPSLFAEPNVTQLPQGGIISSGVASISADNNYPQLNINQSSQRAIINWQSFDIGEQAAVNFYQPNSTSITLNKINSNNPSQIFGQIRAKGQIILQNSSGVYFGKNSRVDVGAIVATTHTVNEDKFMQGTLEFDRNGSTASVINDGEIKTTLNGYVALLAPEVRNRGLIVAQMGTVVMASGEQITLNFSNNNHLSSITASSTTIDALIENKHAVQAHGGTIILSAKAMNQLISGIINQEGLLDAGSDAFEVVKIGGRILLSGDKTLLAKNSITTASSFQSGGEVSIEARELIADESSVVAVSTFRQGNGGIIDVATSHSELSGEFLANGGFDSGSGGQINISSDSLLVTDTSLIQAGSLTTQGSPGSISISTNTINSTPEFMKMINQSIASANVSILTSGAFNFDQVSVIEKTTSFDTLLTINAKDTVTLAGRINSDIFAPLSLSIVSEKDINFTDTSETRVAYLETNSPAIKASGNIWTYGGSGSNKPFIQLTASRLVISRILSASSKALAGGISLHGVHLVDISPEAIITANGNDGGLIDISAQDGQVNIKGLLKANGSSGKGGTIQVDNTAIIELVGARLEANGADGGSVLLVSNKDTVVNSSIVQTNGSNGRGGTVSVSALGQVILKNTAVQSIGFNQGGTVLIGNDIKNNTIPLAQFTYLDALSSIQAFAINNHPGGFIETSGQTISILATVNSGRGGTWLIDPFDLIINSAIAANINSALQSGQNVTLTTASETNTINSDPVTTTTGISGTGNITLNATILSNGEGDLSLIADNNIYINAAITLSGTDSGATLSGSTIYLGANITTTGNQLFTGDVVLNASPVLDSGNANVTITGNISATSGIVAFLGNGNYLFNGSQYLAGASADASQPIGVIYNNATKVYSWLATTSVAEALIVAGGGGGGKDMGGGGGGGGVIAQNVTFNPGGAYQIAVGAGGIGSVRPNTNGESGGHHYRINATQGGHSTLATASGTLTAIGGGYGGTGPWSHTLQGQAGSGGSGGGASGYQAQYSGRNGAGTAGQGYAGASGAGSHVSGGGGGAGGPGSTGRSHGSATGGPGVQNCILGTCYYWGGGGGGSSYSYNGGNGGIGGGGGGAVGVTTGGAGLNNGSPGGGGNINQQTNRPGGHGGANTGGGGGGGSHYRGNNEGGNGGSGIVVLSYQNMLTINTGNGAIDLQGNISGAGLSLATNHGFSQIQGNISGDIGIVKSGTGTLTLSGNNTYSGSTTLSAGTIAIASATAIPDASSVILDAGATLDLYDYSMSVGAISGDGSITNSGNSTAILTVGSLNTSTTFNGLIENGVGTLGITKVGSGILTLTGTNTYSANTTITAGFLGLGSADAIGSTGDIIFNGGGLQYSASNTIDYSSGSRFGTGSQNFNIDTNGQNITWSGNLVTTASSLNKTGVGNLTLTGTIGSTALSFDPMDMNFSGGNIVLSGTVHPISSLIMAAGTALNVSNELDVIGSSSLGGAIVTSGITNFRGPVTLVANTSVTSNDNSITLGGATNGEFELILNAGSGAVAIANVGDVTPVSRLEVTSTTSITLNGNITTVMGLADGWLFEKFNGYFPTNTMGFATATPKIIRTNEMTGATGSDTSMVYSEMRVCPSNNCDSSYTYRVTGYFIPTSSGNWSFSFNGDDGHLLYMGTAGQTLSSFQSTIESNSSWNHGSKNFLTGNTGCCGTQTGTRALVQGAMYPIYASMGEGGGGDYFNIRLRKPDGSYINGGQSNSSYGAGLYFTPGGAGGASTRAGAYFTGNVVLNSDVTITSPNATATISGNIAGQSANENLIVNTGAFTAGNISGLASTDMRTTNATIGDISSVSSATFSGTINGANLTSIDNVIFNVTNMSVTSININNTLTINSEGDLALASPISGTGKLIKLGASSLNLTGTNTFSGGVDLNSGTLVLGSIDAIGSSGNISMLGGTLKYTVSNTTDYSARFSTADNQFFKFDTNGQAISMSGNLISSGGTLEKLGSNRLSLSGTNTFTGNTTITAGDLYLNSAGALTSTNNIIFSGSGRIWHTANNNEDYSSRFTSAANQAIKVFIDEGVTVTWSNGIAGNGTTFTKEGAGSLIMNGSSNNTGFTRLNDGKIYLGRNNTFSTNSRIILAGNAAKYIDLGGYSQSWLSLEGSSTVKNSSASNATLTITGPSTTTFSGYLQEDASGTISLVKSGSGELNLTGRLQNFSGDITINAGKLTAGNASADGFGSGNIIFNGGILKYLNNTNDFSSRISVASQAIKVDTNGQNVIWTTDLLNSSSSLTKSGTGTFTISGAIGINNSDSNAPGYNPAFVPLNLSVTGGTLSLPGTVVSMGNISLQGGSLNCPGCPSLGNFVASQGATVNFSSAIFDSLTLASNVVMTADSILVYNTSSIGGSITTAGPMTFGGAVTLVAPTTLTSTDNPIAFNSTVDGFTSLTINAGSSTVAFLGAVGGNTNLSGLTVTAQAGIILNNISIMGLSDGLLFEKFDGNHANDVRRLIGRSQQVVRSTEIVGAPGNQQGQIHNGIDICRSGNCDETYTYRITGYFMPQQTGTHRFYMYGDDQNYLYLGTAGQSLSDYQSYVESVASYNKTGLVVAQTGCCSWRNGSRNLVAGELYPLYTVFMEGGGGDYLRMYWYNPDNSRPPFMSGSSQASNGQGYFFNLAGAGAGGGGALGGVTLNGPVTINQDTTINSSRSPVVINGDIISSATPRSLSIIADSVTADGFDGLSGLSLNLAKDSSIDGVISGAATNLTKLGDGDLSLTAANTFSGSTVISAGSLTVNQADVYNGEVLLRTNAGTLGSSLNTLSLSGGKLQLDSADLTLYDLYMNANSEINGIGSSASTLTLPVATVGTEAVPSVATSFTLGGTINMTGSVDIQGPVTLSGDTSISSSNSAITFGNVGTVAGGGFSLSLNSGSAMTSLNADISNINNFSSLGVTSTKLTTLNTNGTQQFGALTLLGGLDLTAMNSNITFDSTINGIFQLTTNTGTATSYFMGAVGTDEAASTLTSLQVTGPSYIAGNISTSGDLSFSSNISITGSRSLQSFNGNISVGGNITAVGSATMALLGNGAYLFNGESFNALSNATEALGVGLVYNSGSNLYSWTAASSSAEVLLVAGGGGGGKDIGGGGGGGGVIAQNVTFNPGGAYQIAVGAGGIGSVRPNTNGENGGHHYRINATQGGHSTLATASGTLTAIGGGYGGTGPWSHTLQGQAGSGGSGGGASGYQAQYSGRNGAGTAGQGYAGASGAGSHVSGGGGGAGGPGSTGRSHGSATGGPGVQNCILGTCYYWGGGGGGSSYSYNGGNGGIGGGGGGAVGVTTGGAGLNNGSPGGGGNINQQTNRPGGHGGANTGGGGGGGSHYRGNNEGGNGGSGIVAIKYVTNNSIELRASNGQVNLPDTLVLSNLSTFNVVEKTVRDYNFTGGLTLINTPFNLVNQRLTAGSLNIDSGSSITNSSGFASVEVNGASIIAGSITTSDATNQFSKDDPVLLARENDYQASIIENPELIENGRVTYTQAEWGQFYGGLMTIKGDTILTSNGQNIQLSSITGYNTGSYNLTVNAGQGWVVLNGEIGAKATEITGNAIVSLLNENRAVYYGNMNYLTDSLYANNQIGNIAITGNEIFIRDDITTYLNQTYTGHVQIGNNGTTINGVLKKSVSLMSVDPTISFIGRSILYADTELGQVIYKESVEKYSFDDEFSTPTHSLSLAAKGACWVSGGAIVACQNDGRGNIYKGLDENGEDKAFYNALRPLASLSEDNITMLFPRGIINNNINISQLSIPQGSITNGAGSISSESIAYSGALSQNAFESGPPPKAPQLNLGGKKGGFAKAISNASKISGAGVLGGQISRVKSSSPVKVMNLEYTGDVLIGEVRSSFSEEGFDNVIFSSDSKGDKSSKKDSSKMQNGSVKDKRFSVGSDIDSNDTNDDEDETSD